MRVFILSVLSCCSAFAADFLSANPYAPQAFESASAMAEWATSTLGGAKIQELTYKERKLVLYFRCYTSGLPTSEPVVFVEKNGRWIQVLRAMMGSFEMEATIEGDALVLWRLEWPEGAKKKTEFLRFNLASLDGV